MLFKFDSKNVIDSGEITRIYQTANDTCTVYTRSGWRYKVSVEDATKIVNALKDSKEIIDLTEGTPTDGKE